MFTLIFNSATPLFCLIPSTINMRVFKTVTFSSTKRPFFIFVINPKLNQNQWSFFGISINKDCEVGFSGLKSRLLNIHYILHQQLNY